MLDLFKTSLLELFSEAYTGPNHAHTWFIGNEPGSGILGTLGNVSAENASSRPPSGTTLAAHTEHLRWSLAHANAFARGEVPTGTWAESWSVSTVDEAAWQILRAELKEEFETLYAALQKQEEFSDPQTLTGIMALAPHAAYHLGAIRQMIYG